MTGGSMDRAMQLFEEAIELPAGDRQAFLDRTGIEPALRERVERMLAADENGASLLDRGPGELAVALDIDPPSIEAVQDRLAGSLEGRYSVGEEVGRGGMATVFRGQDLRHDRTVAIKVLHPEFAADIGSGRFRREIRIVAGLNHPHILALLDSGEADGLIYFVMPFVEGESLRDVLDRGGGLPLDRALDLVGQIGSALAYAHERGVVHRDIKPANILISGDQAVVADFGIARGGAEGGSHKLTRTGVVVGTPTYMSPEQALGDQRIDHRSDIYGLGCVLYEALAGRPPFEAPTMMALISSHILDTPPPLTDTVHDLPEYVERAVGRAMAKAPDDRFQTVGALLETLREKAVVDEVRRTRVAVLVPTTLPGHDTPPGLVQGLHDSMIGRLGRSTVSTLGRTAVLPFADSKLSVAAICRELDADALVESTLMTSGKELRIEARLVDGQTGEGRWSGSFDGNVGQPFDLFAEVGGALATDAVQTLGRRRRMTAATPSVNPAAYERYVRGRVHQQRFTPEELEQAHKYYEAALELDPDFAAPHAGISLIWGSKSVLGMVPALEAGEQWALHARRAIELDPELAEGHQAMAQMYTWFEYDWERAETSYARAIALDPTDVQARNFYAHFLAIRHRPDESDVQILRSLEIDPLNGFTQMFRAIQLGLTGRFAESVDAFEAVPANPLRSFALSWQYLMLGEMASGLKHYVDYFTMLGAKPVVEAMTSAGDDHEVAMVRGAEVLEQMAAQTFVKPNNIIHLFGWGRDIDRAMEWIEKAWEMRDHELSYLSCMGSSPELRADRRFCDFLDRMALPHPREIRPN